VPNPTQPDRGTVRGRLTPDVTCAPLIQAAAVLSSLMSSRSVYLVTG